MTEKHMKEWEKKSTKKINEEFYRLMEHVAQCNGSSDLIDIIDGIATDEQKKDYVLGWHEQDEDDEDEE